MDSLDIWSFPDQFRATVKGLTNVNNERPILTGMAIGLNSTLSITEGTQKLPSCPILLLSNTEGVLQVYYFIHKSLPSLNRIPELIKQIQPSSTNNNILGTQLSSQPAVPFNSLQSFITTPSSSSTEFSFASSEIFPSPTIPSATITSQPKVVTNTNVFGLNQQLSENKLNQEPINAFGLNQLLSENKSNQQPTNVFGSNQQLTENKSNQQPSNVSLVNELPKPISTNNSNKATSFQTPTKITTSPDQPPRSSAVDNKKLLQMVDQFESKLTSLKKPLSNLPNSTNDLDKSLKISTTELNNMTTVLQTSIQSIKSMTSEHIESITKIENARHQIKLSQKENFYQSLKDRELDPWAQFRLDSIKTKYDQIKHDVNVLLQLTHTTIHDKSLSIDDDEKENDDFLPELELSLNTHETMRQRIHKRIRELAHKVSETENDLQTICTKLKPLSLNTDSSSNSKTFDSTFTKTTMSSTRSFHALDAQILSHLQATHPDVIEIRVPSAAIINLSAPIEQKKQSTIEITKPITPSNQPITPAIQPITPQQANLSSADTEGYKNMLRICKTAVDLFSGATSPEQLQELSKTITNSPLSSTQRSNATSIHKTPTIKKSMNTSNNFTSPLKSLTQPIPSISLTPATPAPQMLSSDATHKHQLNKQPTDLSRSQKIPTAGDNAIRSLLKNNILSPSTIPISTQPTITSTPNQIINPTTLENTSSISNVQSPLPIVTLATTPIGSAPASNQLPFGSLSPTSSTHTTSVQSTSPTTKPVTSSGFTAFGSKPSLTGVGLNLAPTNSSSTPFGNTATTTTTTTTGGSVFGNAAATTTSAPSPFGFGGVATTSTASTGPFSTATSPAPAPFGGTGFGGATITPATSSSPSPFGGSGFGATTTSAATTSAPSTGLFGSTFGSTPAARTSAPSPGPFGSSFASGPTALSPFGTGFGATPSASGTSPFADKSTATPSAPTGSIFGGFNGSTASTSSSSSFGSSGFGFMATMPTVSIAAPTTTAPLFGSGSGGGGGTPAFGTGFSGFGAQPASVGSASGFSFGGFGSQPSDATATQSGSASFASPPAAPQPSSPFGTSFGGGGGGTPAASPGFGATSSFGASSTQSGSTSFTAYRK